MGSDSACHRAKHAQRCKAHHVLGHAQHDVRGFFHQVHQHVLFLVVQVTQSNAEEQRKHEDLQHFIGRHGLKNVLGEDVGDEILEVQGRSLEPQPLSAGRQLHMQAIAGLEHIGKKQAQKQRAHGRADKPA